VTAEIARFAVPVGKSLPTTNPGRLIAVLLYDCQRSRLAFKSAKPLKRNTPARYTLQYTPLRGTKRLDFPDRGCANDAK
jgi:hypothetical protein